MKICSCVSLFESKRVVFCMWAMKIFLIKIWILSVIVLIMSLLKQDFHWCEIEWEKIFFLAWDHLIEFWEYILWSRINSTFSNHQKQTNFSLPTFYLQNTCLIKSSIYVASNSAPCTTCLTFMSECFEMFDRMGKPGSF